MKWFIQMTWMETLNKYLGIFPTIKNSPLAVASTEFGNFPFTEATHVSHLVAPSHCVEEPVRPDAQNSPGVASRDAPRPRKY